MTEDVNRQNNKASRIYPAIFMTASLGGLSFLAFNNGFLLAYFSRLKIASSEILFLLALPSILQFLLVLIFSYLSDRVGKKVIGASGLLCSASAFYLFWQAGFIEGFWRHGLTVMGGHFLWYRDGNDLQQLVCPASSFGTTADPGQVFRKVATDLARGRIPFFPARFLFA